MKVKYIKHFRSNDKLYQIGDIETVSDKFGSNMINDGWCKEIITKTRKYNKKVIKVEETK